MVGDERVEVRGVRELARAFGRIDKTLQGELRDALKAIAADVADATAAKVPRRRGKAAGSVKARATSRTAAIAVGGAAAPYYMWLDFGGSVGRGHKPKDYWSGAIKREWMGKPNGDGRYLYPTIAEKGDDIEHAVEDAVEKVSKKAGFDVRDGLL